MGKKRHVHSLSAQRGGTSAVSPSPATSPRGGARCPHAHAAGARQLPCAALDSRLRLDSLRRGHQLSDASTKFDGRRNRARCPCLHRGCRIAGLCRCGREHVDGGIGGDRSVARRLVVHPGQRTYLPVLAPSLVFPRLHLGALSLAGVTHQASAHADASRPRRGTRLPRQHGPRIRSGAGRTWGPALGADCRSHLLWRRHASTIHGGDHHWRGRTRVPGARPAHRLHGSAGTRQARGARRVRRPCASAMSESSTRSGYAASEIRTSPSWAVATSSRLRIWATATR